VPPALEAFLIPHHHLCRRERRGDPRLPNPWGQGARGSPGPQRGVGQIKRGS
jgi:hypothetical protein